MMATAINRPILILLNCIITSGFDKIKNNNMIGINWEKVYFIVLK
jgi:hypothetical protein